eukprot:m51a1_g3588 hypothetical protein (340) ;mRNA; f:1154116-1155333
MSSPATRDRPDGELPGDPPAVTVAPATDADPDAAAPPSASPASSSSSSSSSHHRPTSSSSASMLSSASAALTGMWASISPRWTRSGTPPPALGPAVYTGQQWTDYEVDGSDDRIARVYVSAKRMSRELEALEALHSWSEEMGEIYTMWAPRVFDTHWATTRSLVILERPQNAPTLYSARPTHSRSDMLMMWLQIGRCVQRLEDLGWMHTALWPGCIYVVDCPRVVISDWGYATRKAGHHMMRSDSGPWVPPELEQGDVSKGCDVYSWIAMLYWILSGNAPERPRKQFEGMEGAEELEDMVFVPALSTDVNRRCCDYRAISSVALKWIEKYCPPDQDSKH